MDGIVWLVSILAVAAFLLFLTQYWMPRTAAFRDSKSRVRIWFGQGEIVLWNPGHTFAFLKNKQLSEVGSKSGGFRNVFAFKNEEAIGPISLQTALFNWNDENVLTSDGQPLKMSIGVWWKVIDVEKYVFKIYNRSFESQSIAQPYLSKQSPTTPLEVARRQPGAGAASFNSVSLHEIADQWLKVLTESVVRGHVNRLAVADVVSSQAMEFLHAPRLDQNTRDVTKSAFNSVIDNVKAEIESKAVDFGLSIDHLEVQHVYLPKIIQDAINETRIAFLAPIKGEREAEAQRISLEKLVSVLGKENVALNQIMSNLKNANFITPLPLMQPLMERMDTSSLSSPTVPTKGELPNPSA